MGRFGPADGAAEDGGAPFGVAVCEADFGDVVRGLVWVAAFGDLLLDGLEGFLFAGYWGDVVFIAEGARGLKKAELAVVASGWGIGGQLAEEG